MLRLAVGAALLGLAGCTHTTPHFTALSYDRDGMEILGPATGSASHYFIIGLGPGGEDKGLVVTAYKRALESAGADALVNVVADQQTKVDFFGILVRRTLVVHGTAVRYKR